MSELHISSGFRGRGRGPGSRNARVPPGQYLGDDFPGAVGRADAGTRSSPGGSFTPATATGIVVATIFFSAGLIALNVGHL